MTRDLDSILSDVPNVASLIREAFEAGRAQGQAEGRASVLALIDRALENPRIIVQETGPFAPGVPPATPATSLSLPPPRQAGQGRATPGSVKPAVLQLVKKAGAEGITPAEVARVTGFKFNSVRGTLWALGNDNLIESRNGRWYGSPKKREAADVEPNKAPSAAFHEPPSTEGPPAMPAL